MMLKSGRLVALTMAATLAMAPIGMAFSQTDNQKDLSSMSNTRVKLITNKGDIVLELDGEKAPVTTENFLNYVKEGFYTNVIFHRVIPNFMIQGGGFEPGMKEKNTNAPIKNEADNGLKNDKYTIAMARTQDPHSASAQFFINSNNNDFLNFTAPTTQGWGYAVFGKVVEGTEVVDSIEKVATGTRGFHGDVPREDIIIESAEIIE
ncbi:Peptidyl-prolyl cis-trans isomerase B [Oligella ureolytica]|uniref:Peptidyl-prolyl cis-trans isomerase n=2 Tax=Oligella ureolytica TaxID=90244 RepID=A0A378XJP8_9BURK|nr:Peptidyl-prolyl cis-trans isomerase B [Oligella ureolytica]SUA57565.1 Peptidyl-prolyl cis-trans isomerase B [Oligella ureolytica]